MSSKIINNDNTLIIFDWDDTLFPTKWFIKKKINLNKQYDYDKYNSYFKHLDNIVYNLLSICTNLGNVIIITNAMPEWVYTSADILPKTKKIIRTIKIISARQNYQHTCKISEWKKMAFKKENKKQFINIISIGDALYEYNALVNLHKKTNDVLLKSIKFVGDPTNVTLIDQLQVLKNSIKNICVSPRHYDLNFQSNVTS